MNGDLRWLLTGGDRRSIADSKRVRAIVEKDPKRVRELASLTEDEDWLVAQRSCAFRSFAHSHFFVGRRRK